MAELTRLAQHWLTQLQAPASPDGPMVTVEETEALLTKAFSDGCTHDEYVAAHELVALKRFGSHFKTLLDSEQLQRNAEQRAATSGMFDGMQVTPLDASTGLKGFQLNNARYTVMVEIHPQLRSDALVGLEVPGIPYVDQYVVVAFEEGRLVRFAATVYPLLADQMRLALAPLGSAVCSDPQERNRLEKSYGVPCHAPATPAAKQLEAQLIPAARAIGGRSTVADLRRHLTHPSIAVRKNAVELLQWLGSADGFQLLEEVYTNSKDIYPEAAQIAAARCLGAGGVPTSQYLVDLLLMYLDTHRDIAAVVENLGEAMYQDRSGWIAKETLELLQEAAYRHPKVAEVYQQLSKPYLFLQH